MFQSNKVGKSSSSILSADAEVYGDLKFSGNMLVYGKVFGSVVTKGSIRTGKGSFIKGEVKAEEAVINGNIKGDVIVSGKVTLGSNSHLMGNLTAGILVIQEGARFDGLCNMVKDTRSKTKPLLKQNQSEI
tara:strand:- start:1023 stop:1415 length:393 start_codon:yes stop_codon:yes gene_type:complete